MEYYYEKFLELVRKSDYDEEDKKGLMNYFEELYNRSEILAALEQGGVNNWEWYTESLVDYFVEEESKDGE